MDVRRRMIVILILLCIADCILCRLSSMDQCVTGYMTDVQSWVDISGELTKHIDARYAIDVSNSTNPIELLQIRVNSIQTQSSSGIMSEDYGVKYLSMASCGLIRVPKVFNTVQNKLNDTLAGTLEYLTFYGNDFVEVSAAGEEYDVIFNATNIELGPPRISLRTEAYIMWFNGFQEVVFEKLKELDLRACGIKTLKPFQFKNMPRLEALYLGENAIYTIQANAFGGLNNLLHLDLSRNHPVDINGSPNSMLIESAGVFQVMEKLKSLDFSFTKMNQRNVAAFRILGKSLERLSVCFIAAMRFGEKFFQSTSLKILDVSGNYEILSRHKVLSGLESTLEVLHANEIGLNNFDIFENFTKLEVLALNKNEITSVKNKTAMTLNSLKTLSLAYNRIKSWQTPTYTYMPALKMINLANNNINMISEEMMLDVANITYLGFGQTSIVCNCRSKDIIQIASKNELKYDTKLLSFTNCNQTDDKFVYHRGFMEINEHISVRKNISYICANGGCEETEYHGKFLLLDYNPVTYSCFQMSEESSVPFSKVIGCEEEKRGDPQLAESGVQLLMLWLIPGLLIILMFVGFTFRKNLRYCYVTMRNSAMIGMVNKNRPSVDETIFNYDVFVSYCNVDRPWVLDQLLSHLETNCSVSLCLHERDFQVGLSILENIVFCMDRSRFIMLVISQQFLLSQWCQFEMHLAQHRLLETRREDLILILLEDIPRSLRPNTLHYLMLTKTYIVWPKNKSEQPLFWKRLTKTVVTHKLRQLENVSLA